jgi:type IV secretory pathway protease TraF
MAFGVSADRTHLGRPLPILHGGRVVGAGNVYLMNRQSGDSLDGRYFGPLPTTTVVGRADPLWTDQKY